MKTKMFEIRDRMTFIPVMCVCLDGADSSQGNWLLQRAGVWHHDCEAPILMIALTNSLNKCNLYSCDWGDRTFQVAHQYIDDNWTKLQDGDVIDVEFILGETPVPKKSEREN